MIGEIVALTRSALWVMCIYLYARSRNCRFKCDAAIARVIQFKRLLHPVRPVFSAYTLCVYLLLSLHFGARPLRHFAEAILHRLIGATLEVPARHVERAQQIVHVVIGAIRIHHIARHRIAVADAARRRTIVMLLMAMVRRRLLLLAAIRTDSIVSGAC